MTTTAVGNDGDEDVVHDNVSENTDVAPPAKDEDEIVENVSLSSSRSSRSSAYNERYSDTESSSHGASGHEEEHEGSE